MDKINYWKEFKHRVKAVIAAIRGKEIEFAVKEIEKWFKGEIVSQKITNAVYDSEVYMELDESGSGSEVKLTSGSGN